MTLSNVLLRSLNDKFNILIQMSVKYVRDGLIDNRYIFGSGKQLESTNLYQ